jgi:hypothetical protein
MPIARQRVSKHISAIKNISIAMQRADNATIEEDVSSMGQPRDYTSSPAVNWKSVVEREREWSESSAVKEEGFG